MVALELYKEHGAEAIIDVVKHELIHSHIGTAEENPHGPIFMAELERIGARLHCKQFARHKRRHSNKRYTYACPTCGARTTTKRRSTLSCSQCNPIGYDKHFAMILAQREVLKEE